MAMRSRALQDFPSNSINVHLRTRKPGYGCKREIKSRGNCDCQNQQTSLIIWCQARGVRAQPLGNKATMNQVKFSKRMLWPLALIVAVGLFNAFLIDHEPKYYGVNLSRWLEGARPNQIG